MALGISDKLESEILEWEKAFSKLPVRWLLGKNLHITLVPPWYEENIEAVIQKLNTVKSTGVFDIEFNKVTFGPDPKRPRLIWAEGEASKPIVELKTALEKILNKEPERRLFRLHLTLARFRPETFSSFPIKELNEKVFWRDRVTSFLLMESRLSREGADYTTLREFPI